MGRGKSGHGKEVTEGGHSLSGDHRGRGKSGHGEEASE